VRDLRRHEIIAGVDAIGFYGGVLVESDGVSGDLCGGDLVWVLAGRARVLRANEGEDFEVAVVQDGNFYRVGELVLFGFIFAALTLGVQKRADRAPSKGAFKTSNLWHY
jgi:hypothetical protein